ncbi:MAG: hypothetical protein K8M05_06935 [Deltaproteobacteria bacterium]|nr:hypothetical protein [Kofleriaceae bacterium]
MSSFHLAVALGVAVACTGACTGGAPDQVIDIVFDVCQPFVVNAPEADTLQRAGIERALDLWRERGVAAATTMPLEGAPVVEVRFADASPAFHGVYEDEVGVIYINSRLTDPETMAIVVSHELGHAFGMWHVSSDDRHSVMNPGNLEIAPTSDDGVALVEMWGPCAPAH